MNKRLIVELSKRTLAEYSVFMTVCGIGAFICAMMLAVPLSNFLTGFVLFGAAACFWLALMAYLWLHFFHAARRSRLTPSTTNLFHTIQCVALGLAALPFVLSRGAGPSSFFFFAVALGADAALGAFFICYIFLAGTLCRKVATSALPGLAFALLGFCFSFHHIVTK